MLIIMEKLIILRMFFCFPLFGLLLPDAGILLSKNQGHIPMIHFIIEVALIFCVLICTAAIAYKKRHQGPVGKTNGATFY
jgi:hypothetical protein